MSREQILDVAVRIATEQGLAAVTIDRVARDSGTTRAVVASQFGALPDLIAALVDRETHDALSRLMRNIAELPAHADLVQAEIGIVTAMIDASAAAPASWRMLLNPAAGDPPELHHRTAAGRALVREHVRNILDDSFPGRVPDPQLTAHIHQLAGEELVRLHLNDPTRYPLARILRQVEALASSLVTSESALPNQSQ